MELLEAGASNGVEVPLGRIGIGVAHILFDQREQQLLLRRVEIAGGKALKSAQAVAPADTREHVREKRFGGHDGDLGLFRVERADEIKTMQPFVAEHRKTRIWSGQVLQRLRAQEQRRRPHAAVGAGEGGAEMMAREQPSPCFAAHRLAEDRNPIVCRSHALDGVASGPRSWRIMLQVFQFRRPQNVVVTHDRCDLVVALAAGGRAQKIV